VLRLTDGATGTVVSVALSRQRTLVIAAVSEDPGTLLAADTFARTADLLGFPVRTASPAVPELNVRPGHAPGPPDVVVDRPGGVPDPPYGLEHRLAWLAGLPLEAAREELLTWRRLVAGWAEEPSKPMCAEVQESLLGALADDLDTSTAVEVMRRSLELGLPAGSLFETWAWADRALALDLAADVGR
jgi:hypothetical protein